MSTVYVDPSVLWERALARVEHVGDCWIFRGALQTQGYASVSSGKKGRKSFGKSSGTSRKATKKH